MRIYNSAATLFNLQAGYRIFNDDTQMGSPSDTTVDSPSTDNQLNDLEPPVQEWMRSIETLQKMGASQAAQQQQSQLESYIKEAIDNISIGKKACDDLIIRYRQEGVPDSEKGPEEQSGGEASAPEAGMDGSAGGAFDASAQGATTGPNGGTAPLPPDQQYPPA